MVEGKRLAQRALRGILALALSVSSGTNWGVLARTGQEKANQGQPAPTQTPANRKNTFTLKLMSDGKTPTGQWIHRDDYVASDGAKVYVDGIKFDSLSSETAAVQALLKDATKITERTPRVGKDGSPIGERIIAVFPIGASPTNSQSQTLSVLIWTDGVVFREIASVSLEDVLGMEKVLKLG